MSRDRAPGDGHRRRVLSWLLGTTAGALAAAIFYPMLRFLSPPRMAQAATEEVDAGAVNDPRLLEQGYKIIRFGEQPVIVIRIGATDVRAFSAVCTHLGCVVEYQKSMRRIWCNCHDGVFDLQGRNLAGPPPRPLERYKVNLASRGPEQAATIVVSES